MVLVPRGGVTTFRLSTDSDVIQLPELVVPVSLTTWIFFVLLVVLAAASAYFVRTWGRTPLWILIVYIVAFVVGFLSWAAARRPSPSSACSRDRSPSRCRSSTARWAV